MILPIRKLPIIFNRVFDHSPFFFHGRQMLITLNVFSIPMVYETYQLDVCLCGFHPTKQFVNYIDQASLHSIVGNVWTVKLELLAQKILQSKTTCRHVNWFIWTFCSSCVENLKFSKHATKHAPESAGLKRDFDLCWSFHHICN